MQLCEMGCFMHVLLGESLLKSHHFFTFLSFSFIYFQVIIFNLEEVKILASSANILNDTLSEQFQMSFI